MSMKKEVVLVLYNIRSAGNVGSIFRTANCAGVLKIFLVGVTPSPIDRFGRIRKDISKVALGAEKNVLWENVGKIEPLLARLKKDGFKIVALEQDKRSVDYKKFKLKTKAAIILGEEVHGLAEKILKKCDKIIEIKMTGKKESLNVSVAVAVALFGILGV